jgi:hypothetical protein
MNNKVNGTRKISAVLILILALAIAFASFNQNLYTTNAGSPTKLYIYTSAPNVLADNNTYRCIYVQLQDVNGKISRATQDIVVGLSSSQTNIGTVDSSITIPQGETFAQADFTSTYYPGSTTISASATGFTTVLSTITTVGPIPSALALYGIPSTLPSDGNTYPALMIHLQDSSGNPARAPHGGIQVALTSSNTSIGQVTQNVIIPQGDTYAIASFTTTTLAQTEAKIQPVNVTATAQGYAPSQLTISTTPIAQNPTKLKIFAGPPKISADQNSYNIVAIQMQNASGFAAQRIENTNVNLASSDRSICQINDITIAAGKCYELVSITTTYKPGSTSITATANNFPLTSQTIITFGFTASKLAIYCLPANLPSDGASYKNIQLQLQDAQGRPAINIEPALSIKLYSSQPSIGVVPLIVTMPFGTSMTTANLTTTFTPGNTMITAQASGYTTGQANLNTTLIDSYILTASAAPNGTITPSGSITVNLGGNQNFNLTANIGYHISDILIDNISQGTPSSYTLTNITQEHTIYADFAINKYLLTITQTANGKISPETCNANYGDTPAFTITPNEGYYISNITSNGKTIPVTSSDSQDFKFTPVTSNGSLSAHFALKQFAIEVKQTLNGKITPGTTTVDYNGTQTFSITPKTGYHIADVLFNAKSVGAVNSFTAQNIREAATLSAVFEADLAPTPTPTQAPTPTPTPRPVIGSIKTQNGTSLTFALNGNISNPHITNIQINTNQTALLLSFDLTADSGSTGLANLTIPISLAGPDTAPTVYIDGQAAKNQRFVYDDKNCYVWFTTLSSSHHVTIVFPLPPSTNVDQNMTYVLAGTLVAVASTLSTLFVLRKKLDLKTKVENFIIKIKAH